METVEKHMIFKLNDQYFGIPVEHAISIEKMQEITEVPGTEKYIRGLIPLRGEIVPVIDVKERLSLRQAETEEERILIIRIGDMQAGFIIDEAIEVRDIETSKMDTSPQLLKSLDKNFVHGVVQGDDHLVILLNIAAVLDIEEEEEEEEAIAQEQ